MSRKLGGVQVWSRLSNETDSEITRLAARMGIAKAVLINLCVVAGKGSIMRAVYPEEAIDSKQWASILSEMVKRGDVKLPAEVKRKVAASKRVTK